MTNQEKIQVDTHENVGAFMAKDDKSSEGGTNNSGEPQPTGLSWATWLSIFFLGLSGAGPIALGFTLVSISLGNISAALGGDTSLLLWVVSGWSIASAATFSVAGRLSDIFGRRSVILAGNLLNVVGSIVGGTAKSIPAILAAEILQGAACGLVLIIYAGIPELLPRRHRGIGLAWTEFVLDVPWLALAALLGQLIAQRASWRLVYWINLGYGGVSFIGTAIFYYPPSRPQHDFEKSRWQQLKELDFVAIFLFVGGLTTFLVGLAWANTPSHAWKSASVIVPIIVGFFTFVSAFMYDWRFVKSERAMLPADLLKNRQFMLMAIILIIAGAVFYPMPSVLTHCTILFFEQEAVKIGVTQIPNGFGQIFSSCILVSLLAVTKRPKWHIFAATVVQTIFIALYAVAIPDHKSAWMAFQFFGQSSFPWITAVSIVMVSLQVPQRELGIAIGLLGTSRSLGGALGNTIFGAILDGTIPAALQTRIGQVAAGVGITSNRVPELVNAVTSYVGGNTKALAAFPQIDKTVLEALLAAYKAAYAHCYRLVFYSTIPLTVIAVVCSLFLKDCSELMTEEISVQLEKDVLKNVQNDKGHDAPL